MKSCTKFKALVPALLVALAIAAPFHAFAADKKRQAAAAADPFGALEADPATGLPKERGPLFDPNWKEPANRLAEVNVDNLPLSEVALMLRKEFKESFDVLIPSPWQDPGDSARTIDPGGFTIRLQLKNVSASEVFNAMNLVFETQYSPLRWELKMNGNRPTALVRMLPELVPPSMPRPEMEPQRRMIYFVGDLLGEDAGGMTMEQLVKTITDVYHMSYGGSKNAKSTPLQFHKDAQLLIMNGTPEQLTFIQQTLTALKKKADNDRVRKAVAKEKSEPPKAH